MARGTNFMNIVTMTLRVSRRKFFKLKTFLINLKHWGIQDKKLQGLVIAREWWEIYKTDLTVLTCPIQQVIQWNLQSSKGSSIMRKICKLLLFNEYDKIQFTKRCQTFFIFYLETHQQQLKRQTEDCVKFLPFIFCSSTVIAKPCSFLPSILKFHL